MLTNTSVASDRISVASEGPSAAALHAAPPSDRGWIARVRRALGHGRAIGALKPVAAVQGKAPGSSPSSSEIRSMTQHLVGEDRYVFVLLDEASDVIQTHETTSAWKALEEQMALVPGGVVPVVESNGSMVPTELAGFYLDRLAVTNRQFLRFVQSGGYDHMEIWPQEVWPSLMRFTDRTARPGPRHWENGKYPAAKADHPVSGVCWYEALAYARWVGKRLATAAEWQKAGGWPEQLSGGGCNRYPWGDIFDPRRANLSQSGGGRTVPVREFVAGSTPNGIYQMSGNVWEWLADPLESIPSKSQATLEAWTPLRRIIGGAFDTYFPAEATCHYVTGQPELDRRANIGFRCCVSVDRLRPHP
jgi:gamma-glutamyl hercynylcysteine S-oxide synthase